MSETSRCTGHCCKDFTLPLSPMEFQHHLRRFEKTGRWKWNEIEKIARMVIFKFQDWTSSNRERNYKKLRGSKDFRGQPQYHYTCRHFDAASGNCMNYENRPDMCRAYPYGRDCNYRGCTRKCDSLASALEKEKPCPSPTV